jgi:hypothetical protein
VGGRRESAGRRVGRVDCGLWTVDCGLWTVHCGLWSTRIGHSLSVQNGVGQSMPEEGRGCFWGGRRSKDRGEVSWAASKDGDELGSAGWDVNEGKIEGGGEEGMRVLYVTLCIPNGYLATSRMTILSFSVNDCQMAAKS